MAYERTIGFDAKQDFAARIARIEAGGLNTNRTLFVGDAEAHVLPRGAFAKKAKPRSRIMPLFLALVVMSVGGIAGSMASANLF
jgi:hypothetical protein